MARREDIPWGLWVGCLAAALLAHAALVVPTGRALARSLAGGFEPEPIEDRVMALDLVEPTPPEAEQFVDVDEADDEVPRASKRVSDRNNRAEQETKAAPGKPSAPSVAGQPTTPSPPGQPTPPQPDAPTSDDPELGDPSLVEAPDGSQSGAEAAGAARDWGKLAGSPGMLRDSFGPIGNPDRLPDVDPGDKSVLDSREHLYASFFSRMRGRILEHWNAQKAIDRYDPSGSRLGGIDRTTVVRIQLDRSGAIERLSFVSESGVDYLDAEATRALNAAGPFPNPPEGLFEDGEFVITVAFTVEPDGGARVFRRR